VSHTRLRTLYLGIASRHALFKREKTGKNIKKTQKSREMPHAPVFHSRGLRPVVSVFQRLRVRFGFRGEKTMRRMGLRARPKRPWMDALQKHRPRVYPLFALKRNSGKKFAGFSHFFEGYRLTSFCVHGINTLVRRKPEHKRVKR
jgi:hypothetical protein